MSAEPRRRLSREARRAQILSVATSLISERGFNDVSLTDIAQHCGITEAGILHHFSTKTSLLIQLLQTRDSLDTEALCLLLRYPIETLTSRDSFPSTGLRETTHALILRNSRQPEIVRLYAVLQAEALAEKHPAHDYFKWRETWALAWFESAAKVDGLHTPRSVAIRTLSFMDGLQLRWLHNPDQIDLVTSWISSYNSLIDD